MFFPVVLPLNLGVAFLGLGAAVTVATNISVVKPAEHNWCGYNYVTAVLLSSREGSKAGCIHSVAFLEWPRQEDVRFEILQRNLGPSA